MVKLINNDVEFHSDFDNSRVSQCLILPIGRSVVICGALALTAHCVDAANATFNVYGDSVDIQSQRRIHLLVLVKLW